MYKIKLICYKREMWHHQELMIRRLNTKVPRVKETIETHHPKVVKVLQTNRLLRTKTKTIHPLEPKHRPTKSEKAKSLVAKLPRVKHLHEIGRAKNQAVREENQVHGTNDDLRTKKEKIVKGR
uniref:Uncharacterized protein n=1 Tax=Cacopsylla melanoneura TaxID=428564 RepID=A0A8D9ASJ6_9HEMI